MTTTSASPAPDRPIVRAIVILIRHWRFLLLCFIVAAIVSGIISFTIPNSYRAVASFLPPQKQSGLLESVTSGLSTTLRSFGLSKMANTSSGVYSYLAILQSKSMGEKIVKKFDLIKVYEISSGSMERAIKSLSENTEFSFEEEGYLTVAVEDTDPKRAAEMANTYVDFLNAINTDLSATEARSNRLFLEQQYNATNPTIKNIEDSFIVFQKRTKLYSLTDQSKAALTASASAYAQLMYQQVGAKVAEKMFGENDADVILAKTKLRELEKTLGSFQSGKGFGDILPPMKDLPKEGMEYMRLYRDYEIFSKYLGFLMPMYQQAKIDEQRQSQAVVRLDLASPPELKSKPKRSIIIALASLSMLVLGMAFVLMRDRISFYRAQHPDEWTAIRESFGKK